MDESGRAIEPLANVTNVTVLVVEKDVWVRTLMTDELRDHGYTCVQAATASEAMDVLHSPVRVDLVTTSLRLPGILDGSALARRVRSEFAFIKIIVVSGQLPDPSLTGVIDSYLRKPFSMKDFIRQVQALLRSNSPAVRP